MNKKGLKWYFCLNQEAKERYQHEIKAAVTSAIQNTTLRPHFVYDGTPDDLTQWLENKNVKVIYHRISFAEALKDFKAGWRGAFGAFLRMDIPLIETEDEFVLYTDTDVIFNKDIHLDEIGRPELFSASTQFGVDDWSLFNSGVMIINIKNMMAEHKNISDYIYQLYKGKDSHGGIQDQEVLNNLYLTNEKFTKLNHLYNHKPYWGIEHNAFIVHYHGPKPYDMQQQLANKSEVCDLLRCLLLQSFWGYEYYFSLFEKYCSDVHVDINLLYNSINAAKIAEIMEEAIQKKNRLLKIKIFKKTFIVYKNKIEIEKN